MADEDKIHEVPTSVAVVTEQTKEVAASLEDMFASDAGAGLQNLRPEDFGVPFISILQKGSPQVSRANAKYVKGAEQGMFMNTLTSELYPGDVGIAFIPCGQQHLLVRWKSRESGGGFICSYKPDDPVIRTFTKDDRGRYIPKDSKDEVVMDMVYEFGIMLKDDGPTMAVLSFASTQLKKIRMWNTVMRQMVKRTRDGRSYNPPTFSHVYRVTTTPESRDQYDWFGFKIVVESEIKDAELYKLARSFSAQAEAGEVRVSAPPQETEASEVPF